jgi:hypothetical protein
LDGQLPLAARMNAREFIKQRAKIGSHKDRAKWQRKAFDKLLREAGAAPIVMMKRVVAYQLANGEIVCTKQRFKDEPAAVKTLQMIHSEHQPRVHEPVRAYPCQHCKGWHITSQK